MDSSNNELLVNAILQTKMFSGLTRINANKLLNYCKTVQLSSDEILFNKGDSSEELYILVKGQLIALLEQEDAPQLIGVINVGESVGELGVISNKPRSLTIKAKKQSILLSLGRDDFHEFMTKYAKTNLWLQFIDTMISRSQSVIKLLANEKIYRHIALIPATNAPLPREFCDFLKKSIKPEHRLRVIDSVFFKEQNLVDNLETINQLILESEKADYSLIFIIENENKIRKYLDRFGKDTINAVFENVGAIYAIADSRSPPVLNKYIQYFFQSEHFPFLSRKELVLLHDAETQLPVKTQQWLEQEDFTLHHHLRYNNSEDFKRLLRFIMEKPNGLVLSGGGTKLWASVGIVKALEALKIPIDTIAGTSAGAIVGGIWSLNQTIETFHETVSPITDAFDKLFSINNLSYPIVSINNGKKYTAALKRVFSDIQTEDLWVPNVYICTDLNTGDEICLTEGALWKAVRASTSLPLVFPPLVNNGHLYVDGGLLNNMPVDQMRQRISPSCFVIAVDLASSPFIDHYNFPPAITFTEALGVRLKLTNKDYIYPALLETFFNSLLVGSSAKTQKNGLIANVLLSPDVANYAMIKIKKAEIRQLVDSGFRYAMNKLEQLNIDENTGMLSLPETQL